MNIFKQQLGIKAAEYLKDGMIVGLGTGSTVYYFLEAVGRRIRDDHLKITAVSTSSITTKQAEILGIPITSVDKVNRVDLTVDGADEVDRNFNGIKGGGGALLMEKVVATLTQYYIWIVDETKIVDTLGTVKLPVEVVQYGARQLFRSFEKEGYQPSFRQVNGQLFVTDMHNFIIDLDLQKIEDPVSLSTKLNCTVGVVEHGLFNRLVDLIIISGHQGVQFLEKTLVV